MAESNTIFQANLAALRRRDSDLADRLAAAQPAPLAWAEARSGLLSATLEHDGRGLALASKYDPAQEAAKLVGTLDHQKSACVVVMGFGLGYHIAEVARQMGRAGMLIVYEPDRALLRAAFERIDHTAWLGREHLIIADDEMDRPALLGLLETHAGLITQGTHLLTHPVSRQRHAEPLRKFSKLIKEVLAFCRTNVATALVNSARTCRNLACNLDVYTAGATMNELHNAAKGRLGICVSAGPSLVKNVDLLRNPQVRANVVLIAVQTALRPLLDRGIKPDFVTALDYSKICKRFYENLPDLPDVTLVAEPKAHPTILDSYPGPVRILSNQFNDQLLGALARPMVPLRSGATVAHLSFYLAQHLGCDPIVFIGQDLGFSDGLYYAPGTAVHQVWSSELNQFNTIEMMEWTRIVRMRGHLRAATDIHERRIYTDEQMSTYLKQFERDFATSKELILDATEGGMAKAHTHQITLAKAIERYATGPVPALPVPSRQLDGNRLAALSQLLTQRLAEVRDMRSATQKTIPILRKMKTHLHDSQRINKLFSQLQKHQRHVEHNLLHAFNLVNTLNTIGAFKRQRTDRQIGYMKIDKYELQSQQIDRDVENLDWLIQSCDEALEILNEARQRAQAAIMRSRSDNETAGTPEKSHQAAA
jgi:hypothetical protein